ncbi:MAG: TrmB family transcriptional regulator [Halobacteria archaeon]
MSIDIDRFESEEDGVLEDDENVEKVTEFLLEHDDRAWKPTEISGKAKVSRDWIVPILNRLYEDGVVRHKGEYWTVVRDKDLVRSRVETDS